MNTDNQLTPEQENFINNLGFYYENYGIPKIGGRILGYIILLDEPVTAEQIAETLHISRASVSTNIRLLMNFGFIQKALVKQGRTDFYKVAENAWENALLTRLNGFATLTKMLEIDTLSENSRALDNMKNWAELMIDLHKTALTEWQKRSTDDV